MDKRKLLLLKFLLNNCSDGYKVFDMPKIYSAVKKYRGDYRTLEEDIMYLKQRKYIDLKYIDEQSICLTIMDNSRILEENIKVERNLSKHMHVYMLMTMIFSGVLAFAGSLIATLLLR